MPAFTLRNKLPSTKVTRDLVSSIEAYVISYVSQASNANIDKDIIAKGLSTKVTDSLGTESFASIAEYSPPLFPDNTSEIEISFRRPYGTEVLDIGLSVAFNLERHGSTVRISYEGPNAREVVTGLYEGVMRCINTSPGRTAFLHPTTLWDLATSILISTLFISTIASIRSTPAYVTWILGGCWLVTYMVWSVAPKLRPFTVFESDRANRNARAWDWMVKGLLGFLVFGLALALFRDKIIEIFRSGS